MGYRSATPLSGSLSGHLRIADHPISRDGEGLQGRQLLGAQKPEKSIVGHLHLWSSHSYCLDGRIGNSHNNVLGILIDLGEYSLVCPANGRVGLKDSLSGPRLQDGESTIRDSATELLVTKQSAQIVKITAHDEVKLSSSSIKAWSGPTSETRDEARSTPGVCSQICNHCDLWPRSSRNELAAPRMLVIVAMNLSVAFEANRNGIVDFICAALRPGNNVIGLDLRSAQTMADAAPAVNSDQQIRYLIASESQFRAPYRS
jgi:hypothetical protein